MIISNAVRPEQAPGAHVDIQQADDADIPALSDLILRVCVESFGPENFTAPGRLAFQRRASVQGLLQRSRDAALDVVRYKATVGGAAQIVGVSEMFKEPAAELQPTYKLLYLMVDGTHHRLGLGARLLAAQLARLEAGSRVELLAAAQAVPFYLRQGFEVTGPPREPDGSGIIGTPMRLVL